MKGILIFLIAAATIILIALLINKLKGVKAVYIEDLTLENGEQKIWEDINADFHTITKMGQAMFMSFSRMRRAHIIITNQRIIISQKVFLGKKYMITHMLYFSSDFKINKDLDKRTEDALNSITAGLYSFGYIVYKVDQNKFKVEMDGKKQYLKILPISTSSSINIEHCRLYSDLIFPIYD